LSITMKEIADLAGVHRSTVDKVIHDRPGVSEPVRARIKKLIAENDYQPNPVGIALKNQNRAFHIAVILSDVDCTDYNITGIKEALSQYSGYDIRIKYHILKFSETSRMYDIMMDIKDKRSADGVIIMPPTSSRLKNAVNELMDAEIPVVCINAPLPDTNTLCYIGGDHSESSRLAAHLLGEFIGRKGQIAIITSAIASENNNSSVKVREENFEKLIQDNYPEISIVEHVESFEDPEITYRKTLDLLRGCPKLKGIYITCGGAYKVGDALNEMNLSNKIAVISHELYPEIIDMLRDNTILCTIGSELTKQGRLALKTLMDYALFGTLPKSKDLFTKSEVILKENIGVIEP